MMQSESFDDRGEQGPDPGEHYSRQGKPLDEDREAKAALRDELEERGIMPAIGIQPLDGGGYGIGIIITPSHGLSDEQIAEVKAIREFEGVPVNVEVLSQNFRPRGG